MDETWFAIGTIAPDSGIPDEKWEKFTPPEAVKQRIEYIQEFYQRTDEWVQENYKRPYIYLSQAEVDAFVTNTTQVLHQIYRFIIMKAVDTTGYSSALHLPQLQRIREGTNFPY